MNDTSTERRIHVGCASGFWGDSQIALPQLLTATDLHYIVFDYLAETTMSILQRARMRDPDLGYATDFVTVAVQPNLQALMERRIRLVSNAGGLNPEKCRDAILALAKESGLSPKIAVVTGDDVSALTAQFRPFGSAADIASNRELAQAVPATLLSANAYLGAEAIVQALKSDADIVIVGRCVDSALMLAIAVYEFGWSFTDYDRTAQASLAGHLVECGPQVTGGLFTDWETVPDWVNIGYPIVSMQENGNFELSKAPGTGGLITPATVSEQLLYEIGDPGAYLLPDVICDFRGVQMESRGRDRVAVSGAKGRAPTPDYKVTVTYQDGYHLVIMMAIRGQRALAKARRTADALLSRTSRQLQANGYEDYSDTLVEYLGAESHYGPHSRVTESREVVLRIAVRHTERKALVFLQKESASAGISMGPGTRSHFGGRSSVQAVIRTASYLLHKEEVLVFLQADVDATAIAIAVSVVDQQAGEPIPCAAESINDDVVLAAETIQIPLSRLAYARSGDKGDSVNIGVIARHPDLLPILQRELTTARVRDYFSHLVRGSVTRYELPGTHALNFVMEEALGGGGSCSLSSDPLGKSYAQMLLDLEVKCPPALLAG
ncbi:DUF1446 domain-containing protein [Alcaligenaceae bacterium]|nr:DUF1446 domain-containing protein [Alcaligenaceae bacterium]